MTDRSTQRPGQIKSLSGQTARIQGNDPQDSTAAWNPPPLNSLEDTGLNMLNVADLALKVLYFGGYMTGHSLSEVVKLPYTGVLEHVMEFLKRDKFVDIRGTGGIGEAGYQYTITSAGALKAREALERTNYAGPAPVTLEQYVQAMRIQNRRKLMVTKNDLMKVTNDLVIAEEMLNKVGPAINSGRSIFLYGPPGNGKTTISEKIGRLILGEDMWIPYAIDIDGQIVQVYDSVNHELSANQERVRHGTGLVQDPRWLRIRRPMIMVGGELTMAGLDLVFDEINKYYEAPFQMKATGGLFLIDDFGRQQVRPQDLLNRWIVPLEKGVDFLTLANGRKIEVPFSVLVIFSTNMDPKDLVDEAFLRRIRHKIEVGNPTYEQFREIFKIMCRVTKVPYNDESLKYLLKEWYINHDRPLRMVHPRDLLSQLIDIASYLNRPPQLDKDLIDAAAASYFVEL